MHFQAVVLDLVYLLMVFAIVKLSSQNFYFAVFIYLFLGQLENVRCEKKKSLLTFTQKKKLWELKRQAEDLQYMQSSEGLHGCLLEVHHTLCWEQYMLNPIMCALHEIPVGDCGVMGGRHHRHGKCQPRHVLQGGSVTHRLWLCEPGRAARESCSDRPDPGRRCRSLMRLLPTRFYLHLNISWE